MSTSFCRALPAAGGICMPDDGRRISPPGTAEPPIEALQGRPDETVERPAGPPVTSPPAPRRRLRRVLFMLLPLALIGGGYRYITGGQVMSTDDAYVEADKVGISTDVSGIVKGVDVTENQHVEAGRV